MTKEIRTHRVAVNAFVLYKDQFLMLKRSRKPLIWVPPGGHLLSGEDPILGLKREVFEETGLQINVIAPVVTWFGKFNNISILSLDYLCISDKQTFKLSDEHANGLWLSLNQLQSGREIYFRSELGFKLSDFYSAWRIYLLNSKRWHDLQQLDDDPAKN